MKNKPLGFKDTKIDLLDELFTTECDMWNDQSFPPQALTEVLCEVETANSEGNLPQRRAGQVAALRAIW